MDKKDRLDELKNLLKTQRVVDIKQIYKAIQTTSRATSFRYLRELQYISSYTHQGKYYTLPEIAQFDKDGFWYYGDIGFSIKGTLVDTLANIIKMSESGQTNSELEKRFRTRVQESLRTLLRSERIARTKTANRYLYISSDTSIAERQIKKHQIIKNKKKLAPWIIAEILIAVIHTLSVSPDIDNIMAWLKKRRSSITREQVEQVFEEYSLEKKTLD